MLAGVTHAAPYLCPSDVDVAALGRHDSAQRRLDSVLARVVRHRGEASDPRDGEAERAADVARDVHSLYLVRVLGRDADDLPLLNRRVRPLCRR